MSLTVVIVFYIYFYKEKVENFCSQFSTPDVILHSCHSIEDSCDNCSSRLITERTLLVLL